MFLMLTTSMIPGVSDDGVGGDAEHSFNTGILCFGCSDSEGEGDAASMIVMISMMKMKIMMVMMMMVMRWWGWS